MYKFLIDFANKKAGQIVKLNVSTASALLRRGVIVKVEQKDDKTKKTVSTKPVVKVKPVEAKQEQEIKVVVQPSKKRGKK